MCAQQRVGQCPAINLTGRIERIDECRKVELLHLVIEQDIRRILVVLGHRFGKNLKFCSAAWPRAQIPVLEGELICGTSLQNQIGPRFCQLEVFVPDPTAQGQNVVRSNASIDQVLSAPGIESEDVGTGTCADGVVTQTTNEHVVSGPAADHVRSGAPIDQSTRTTCVQCVVAAETLDNIVASTS